MRKWGKTSVKFVLPTAWEICDNKNEHRKRNGSKTYNSFCFANGQKKAQKTILMCNIIHNFILTLNDNKIN